MLAELAQAVPAGERFDAVVGDEGQDFRDSWWDALLTCFRDPGDPTLYVFTDEHQRIFDREGSAPIELNPFPLDENLRNSRNIALAFAPLSSVKQRVRNEAREPGPGPHRAADHEAPPPRAEEPDRRLWVRRLLG